MIGLRSSHGLTTIRIDRNRMLLITSKIDEKVYEWVCWTNNVKIDENYTDHQ